MTEQEIDKKYGITGIVFDDETNEEREITIRP